MHTVIETNGFIRAAKRVGVSEKERLEIVDYISCNPSIGDEIPGTGGLRKLRYAAKGKGKSGGYRIITFYSGEAIPTLLLTIYDKSRKDNFSNKDKVLMKKEVEELIKK
jgi:hypothetical protein